MALTEVGKAESLLVEPRGQVNSDAELAVKVPVAAGAREAAAEPAGVVGLELPTGICGEMRVVGMLADCLKRRLRPALEPGEALLAGLEDTVANQPRAQVGGRLSDVVLVERGARDRDLAAEHREECRSGGLRSSHVSALRGLLCCSRRRRRGLSFATASGSAHSRIS